MEMCVDRNCSVIAGLVEYQSVFMMITLVMNAIIVCLEPSVCQAPGRCFIQVIPFSPHHSPGRKLKH